MKTTAIEQIGAKDVLIGILLAASSGSAILAHAFVSVPMVLTVPFVVMPTVLLLVGGILLRKRLYHRFRVIADLVVLGCWTGLLATVAYDLIRPLVQIVFRSNFNSFAAIPIFGTLMTGLPAGNAIAITTGWLYHFWNGISFGIMFALFRPRGGVLAGLLWGLGLECLMLVTYPHLLQVRLDTPGFLATSLSGHSLWGIVLGGSITRWGQNE